MSIFKRIGTGLVNMYSASSRWGENWVFVRRQDGARIWRPADNATRAQAFGSDFDGYAIGEDIYVRTKALADNRALIQHELAHVRQQRKLGILFPVMYWAETAMVGYDRNRFEGAARAAEELYD